MSGASPRRAASPAYLDDLPQIARDEASPAKIPRPALEAEGNSILDSREQNRTTSLGNLPRINQRRQVETHSHFGGVRLGIGRLGLTPSIVNAKIKIAVEGRDAFVLNDTGRDVCTFFTCPCYITDAIQSVFTPFTLSVAL